MSEQQPPYGQQPPPYGQQPPSYGYGQPHGTPMYPPSFAPVPPGGYASFGSRVVATLWDFVYQLPAFALILLGGVVVAIGAVMLGEEAAGGGVVLAFGILVALAGYALGFYLVIRNYLLRQGRTGWTWGKSRAGIRLLVEATGQPPGWVPCLLRYLLHTVLNQLFLIDYLWALWDDKKQTLTDKILGTIVVNQPEMR